MVSGPEKSLEFNGLAVLVVEDEFLIAMEIEEMLTRHGCRVLGPVASVSTALSLIERELPQAALLDVNLRGERVTPVAEALRRRGVPFCLASAYERLDLHQTPEFRNVENVGKPLQEHRLVRALARATTTRQQAEH
jgi:two-component system, response regulator PdtaR